MPRKRMIDPGIWRSEQFNSLPRESRLLFIGIFSNADDEGRLHGSSRFLKANIFPYDDDVNATKVAKWREDVLSAGLAILYEHEGREYLYLPTWLRHQRIDRPSPSSLPSYQECSSNNRRTIDERSSLIEYNIIEDSIREDKDDSASRIFDLWNEQGIIRHKKLTQKARTRIKSASAEYSEDEICTAVKTYAEVLHSPKYRWSHTWTLEDFLQRGIGKFVLPDVAFANYQQDTGGQNGTTRRSIPGNKATGAFADAQS